MSKLGAMDFASGYSQSTERLIWEFSACTVKAIISLGW